MPSLCVPTAARPVPLAVYLGAALLPPMFAAYVLWLAPLDGLLADRTALAARDFTVFWTAGRLAGAGAWSVLVDPAALTAAIRNTFGPGMPAQIWPYPPTALLLATPLALLPFAASLVAYTVGTVSVLPAALRLGPGAALAVLLSPAVADSALAGQNGALTACLFVGGLLHLDRQPLLGGAMLGALVIKPQLALLVPVCLLAGARWRAAAATATVAAALVAASVAVWGLEPWTDYMTRTQAVATSYLGAPWLGGSEQRIFCSAFMAARSLGAALWLAWAVQLATTLACGLAAFRLWRAPAPDPNCRVAATVALCLLGCPWIHGYDMPALAAAIVILWPRSDRSRRAVLAWAWTWPGLLTLFAVPNLLSTLTVGSVAWIALRRPAGGVA